MWNYVRINLPRGSWPPLKQNLELNNKPSKKLKCRKVARFSTWSRLKGATPSCQRANAQSTSWLWLRGVGKKVVSSACPVRCWRSSDENPYQSKQNARAQVFNQLWFWTLLRRFHAVLGSFMILEHTKKTYQDYQGWEPKTQKLTTRSDGLWCWGNVVYTCGSSWGRSQNPSASQDIFWTPLGGPRSIQIHHGNASAVFSLKVGHIIPTDHAYVTYTIYNYSVYLLYIQFLCLEWVGHILASYIEELSYIRINPYRYNVIKPRLGRLALTVDTFVAWCNFKILSLSLYPNRTPISTCANHRSFLLPTRRGLCESHRLFGLRPPISRPSPLGLPRWGNKSWPKMEVPNIISKGVGLTWFSYWYSMILVHEFYYSKYKYIYIIYIYSKYQIVFLSSTNKIGTLDDLNGFQLVLAVAPRSSGPWQRAKARLAGGKWKSCASKIPNLPWFFPFKPPFRLYIYIESQKCHLNAIWRFLDPENETGNWMQMGESGGSS